MRPRATLAGSIKRANKGFALWGPSNIGATLSVWLDAADSSTITLNGSTVSQWSDKSGNGLHFSQATAANQPTYTASNPLSNNLGSIGGTTNAGTIGLICNGTFLTAQIFCVLRYKDGTVNFPAGEYPTAISGPGVSGSDRAIMGASASSFLQTGNWDGGVISKNAAATSNVATPMPLSIVRVDGISSVNQVWRVGCNFSSINRSWTGLYPEFIFLNATATTDIRERIEGYFAWKWGLVSLLPGGHAYKLSPPVV